MKKSIPTQATLLLIWFLLPFTLTMASNHSESAALDDSIRPYSQNPWYWEYKGEPIMLIGASDRE